MGVGCSLGSFEPNVAPWNTIGQSVARVGDVLVATVTGLPGTRIQWQLGFIAIGGNLIPGTPFM